MKSILTKIIAFIGLFIFSVSCTEKKYTSREVILKEKKVFEVNGTINAMSYLDNAIGFSGNDGLFGMIDLQHFTINISQQKYKDSFLNYDIAYFTETDFFMLSSYNPSVLYKTGQNKLEIIFESENDSISYNGIAFFDKNNGILIGNTIDNYFSVIKTNDGGNSWTKITENLPQKKPNEFISTLSNSSVISRNGIIYFVTASEDSNLYILNQNGLKWEKYPLPIVKGSHLKGVKTLDFFSEQQGVVAGGDAYKEKESENNLALTFNGGKSWEVIPNTMGHINCIQYIPETDGNELILSSRSGIWFSSDKGYTWKNISTEVCRSVVCINRDKIALLLDDKIKIAELIPLK